MDRVEKVAKIMEEVDDFYRAGDKNGLNERLRTLDVKGLHPSEMYAYLCSTMCACSHLPERQGFFQRAKDELTQRGEYDERVFSKLEGSPEREKQALQTIHTINMAIDSGRVRDTEIN